MHLNIIPVFDVTNHRLFNLIDKSTVSEKPVMITIYNESFVDFPLIFDLVDFYKR